MVGVPTNFKLGPALLASASCGFVKNVPQVGVSKESLRLRLHNRISTILGLATRLSA